MGGPGSGRKPAPKPLTLLQGSFAENNGSSSTPNDKPTCPAYLDPLAKTEWKFITAKLESMGLLTSVDRPTIETYCAHYAQWRKASKVLQEQGQVDIVEGDKGSYSKVSPWFKVQQACMGTMMKLLQSMGFSPQARSSLLLETRHNKPAPQVARRQRG